MSILEVLFWSYFVIYPVYVVLSVAKDKRRLTAQPEKKLSYYRSTILHLWVPALFVIGLIVNGNYSFVEMGLTLSWQWPQYLAVGGFTVLLGVFAASLKQLNTSGEARESIIEQAKEFSWLLPDTKRQKQYFVWGVSVSAGICEELVFRGYLLFKLAQVMPMYGAVIISSIAFGLMHSYQGVKGVIKTALMGLVFALVYLATDSLIFPILLHCLIDMFAGSSWYLARKFQIQANNNEAPDAKQSLKQNIKQNA